MPVELVKNPLKVCRIIGEDVYSTVLEEDIIVPDISPDVYKILASNATVMLRECEVLTDRLAIAGQITLNVMYASDMEGKPLDSMDVALNFNQAIEMAGIKPKMKETVNPVLQHVDCTMINSRKLNVRAIMDLQYKVEELFDMELATDVRGLSDIQVLREPINISRIVGYNKDRYEVRDELILEEGMPELEQLLKTDARVLFKEDRVYEGKVEITGILAIDLLYRSKDEQESLQGKSFELPFTQYIEIPAAASDMRCVSDLAIASFQVEPSENLNGEKRVLNVYAVINATTKVYKESTEEMVVDAYSPSMTMMLEKDILRLNEPVGMAQSSTIVKESISIKRGEPEIENICAVNVMPIINETRLMDDRVAVEGVLECTAVYMSSYSAEPMCSTVEQIPFRHYVDLAGARLGMGMIAKCIVESVNFALMNSSLIEIRVVLGVGAEVGKPIDKRVVTSIEQMDGVMPDHSQMPAITIYLVQPGDTLWSIAKRYNTTVDALVKLNQIENPNKLNVGAQILILKSVRITH